MTRRRTQATTDWPKNYHDEFWRLYPRRVEKIRAMKALDKVRERGDVPWAKITTAILAYTIWLGEPCWRPEPKHPATWLNAGCWDDELPASTSRAPPQHQQRTGNGFAAVRRNLMN